MSNFNFSPDPESPVGTFVVIPDPDTGYDVEAVIASDGFEVTVSAGAYNRLPGVGLYVPAEERAVFGFLHGIADISSDALGIVAEEVVYPTFMSRHEAPLSVIGYREVLPRTIANGQMLVSLFAQNS